MLLFSAKDITFDRLDGAEPGELMQWGDGCANGNFSEVHRLFGGIFSSDAGNTSALAEGISQKNCNCFFALL